jgi:hypothetical protein
VLIARIITDELITSVRIYDILNGKCSFKVATSKEALLRDKAIPILEKNGIEVTVIEISKLVIDSLTI